MAGVEPVSQTDLRKRLEALYLPPAGDFTMIDVPEMLFVMLDGEGSPRGERYALAIRWLFAVIQPMRKLAKQRMGKDFLEPPLETLWWADDPADFVARRLDKWKWRAMIPAPDWAEDTMLAEGLARSTRLLGDPPGDIRLERFREGLCAQIMHIGPNESELEVLQRLYGDYLPTSGLVPNGPYHEIYLTDADRVAPHKRRTVLRQPVRPAA